MKFSIIIPSYNQAQYIERTFKNVSELKSQASLHGFEVEVLLFDSCSEKEVQEIIKKYDQLFDFIDISKDKGQYDAINKGIKKATGDYWTWLNTDDYIDIPGFLKLAKIVSEKEQIDYIFGDIDIINENDERINAAKAYDLSLNSLLNRNPSIFQPGSFFKKRFTDKIGLLTDNNACFDYEYILRLLSQNAVFYRCDFVVSQFRFYKNSKSGSIVPVFIREQLKIGRLYGRKTFSYLTFFLNLRLFKHFLFPRK